MALILDCSTITIHAGKYYKALIDSGVAISLIRYSIYQLKDDSFKTPIQLTTTKLNTADRSPVIALGVTALHLRIVHLKCTYNFIICDWLPFWGSIPSQRGPPQNFNESGFHLPPHWEWPPHQSPILPQWGGPNMLPQGSPPTSCWWLPAKKRSKWNGEATQSAIWGLYSPRKCKSQIILLGIIRYHVGLSLWGSIGDLEERDGIVEKT